MSLTPRTTRLSAAVTFIFLSGRSIPCRTELLRVILDCYYFMAIWLMRTGGWVVPDQMCMDTMQTPLLLERRWAHLAPFWIDQFDVVVSMTTSGFGASGWRAKYSFEIWAEEAMGVAQHVGMEPKASNKKSKPQIWIHSQP